MATDHDQSKARKDQKLLLPAERDMVQRACRCMWPLLFMVRHVLSNVTRLAGSNDGILDDENEGNDRDRV